MACTPKPNAWLAITHALSQDLGILFVVGVATCTTGGHKCRLEPAVPQGINKEILILNLVCDGGETGPDVMNDVPVSYVHSEIGRLPTGVTIEPGHVNVPLHRL